MIRQYNFDRKYKVMMEEITDIEKDVLTTLQNIRRSKKRMHGIRAKFHVEIKRRGLK